MSEEGKELGRLRREDNVAKAKATSLSDSLSFRGWERRKNGRKKALHSTFFGVLDRGAGAQTAWVLKKLMNRIPASLAELRGPDGVLTGYYDCESRKRYGVEEGAKLAEERVRAMKVLRKAAWGVRVR
jgi:hypothetical protein